MTAIFLDRLSRVKDPNLPRTAVLLRYSFAALLVIIVGCLSRTGIALQMEPHSISLAEALESTLHNHPSVHIQDWEIESARGSTQQAAGQFDTSLQSALQQLSQDIPITGSERTSLPISLQGTKDQSLTSTSYSLSINKLFRNGLSISSFANVGRSKDNLGNQSGSSLSQVNLQLTVPLLRARGHSIVDATEMAARTELVAKKLDRIQVIEQLLTNTASSYWALVAAKGQLSVALASEDRGRTLVETVKVLIDADHVARNDIYQVTANLADRTATRIAAEQALEQARIQLGLDMGLSTIELSHVGDPSDDFPPIAQVIPTSDDAALEAYLEEALVHRADFEAAEDREKEARILYRSAQNGIEPQINWQLSTGYTQLRETGSLGSFFGSSFTALHRPDVQTGIVYQFSPNNQVAKGQLLQAQAKLRVAELQKADLRRQIAANVRVALSNVRNSGLRLERARQALEAFQKTLDGERQKFSLGQSSLTDLLTIEDRLTTSASREVDAEQAYAVALANLRLATGTLSPDSAGSNSVPPSLFRTVPAVPGSNGPH
ncbi:MAG TPA: TolC family protein [Candidatus Angelobacter sp.]